MRLVNHLNEIFEIRVKNYTYKNSVNVYSESDALEAILIIKKGEFRFERELKFLLIEELELFEKWFELVGGLGKYSKSLKFLDVDLECKKYTRGNISFIKFIINDLYNKCNKPPISWDFIICKKNVNLISIEIQKTIKEFPCRCGMKHDSFKL